jgi:hypothetical protein
MHPISELDTNSWVGSHTLHRLLGLWDKTCNILTINIKQGMMNFFKLENGNEELLEEGG